MNRFDLIITSRKPGFSAEDWQQSPLYGNVQLNNLLMCFAVSVEHPLSERESVTWAEVVQEPLMFLDNTYTQKALISERLAQAGFQLPANVYYANQVHTIIKFVEKNAACGFLPMETVQDNPLVKGLLLPDIEPHSIYLVWRKDRHLYHAARQFVETAREVYHRDSPAQE